MRRTIRALALGTALAAGIAVFGPLAAAGAAGTDSGKDEAIATLKVTAPNVEVKAKGKDSFAPAKDGDEVKAGDTVRTDATGLAEIRYGDDAYTRLDVNTTFKITKLTDEQGNRQVQGTIESGQTWNRTAKLTDSESFEQTGADATAAVEGTAFAVQCDAADHCVFTGVVDDVSLTGKDGVKKLLNPLDECDSSSGVLCGDITTIDPSELPQWIIENLIKDVAEGYEYPDFFTGTVVVQDGAVFFVPDEPADETPPPPPNPVVDSNPVDITSYGSDPTPDANGDPLVPGPSTAVISQDERSDVTFVLQVTDSSGGNVWVQFTSLPPAAFGLIRDGSLNAVVVGTHYGVDEVFTFAPVEIEPVCDTPSPTTFAECFTNGSTGPYPSVVTQGPAQGSVQWSSSFAFKAYNDLGGESAETTVTLTSVDDICTTGTEGTRPAQDVVDCPVS